MSKAPDRFRVKFRGADRIVALHEIMSWYFVYDGMEAVSERENKSVLDQIEALRSGDIAAYNVAVALQEPKP